MFPVLKAVLNLKNTQNMNIFHIQNSYEQTETLLYPTMIKNNFAYVIK